MVLTSMRSLESADGSAAPVQSCVLAAKTTCDDIEGEIEHLTVRSGERLSIEVTAAATSITIGFGAADTPMPTMEPGRGREGFGATRLAAACWAMLGDKARASRLMRKTMKIYPDFEIDKWLSIMPIKDHWHKEQYREGLKRAGFK